MRLNLIRPEINSEKIEQQHYSKKLNRTKARGKYIIYNFKQNHEITKISKNFGKR